MKVVVTGGAGFIGSHIVKALVSQGANVHVVDNLITGYQENVHRSAVLHVLDIANTELRELIVAEQPEMVFHLAAQVDVLRSVRDPRYDAEVNILGTVNLLQACCEAATVKKVIYSSSSAVYGDATEKKITEDIKLEPISYYGVSKLTPERYLQIFHKLYGLCYTVLRYANVYGPNQTANGEGGVVAIFLERLKRGLPLTINGDGEQTRDFIFVKDVVRANLAAMTRGDNASINIGTGCPTTVKELAHMLIRMHGSQRAVVYQDTRPGDIRHSCLDNTKAHDLLRWSPDYNIEDGLQQTLNFVLADR